MPRKWGAKAAAKVGKNIARTRKIPHSKVKVSNIASRVSARLISTGKAVPGAKVRARAGESVEQMYKRLQKIGKKGQRVGKGTSRKKR